MRARIAVHAAAGIGGDLLDLDDARTEPALCCRLHGSASQRSSTETIGQASVAAGFTANRSERCDGTLRGTEPRQAVGLRRSGGVGALRIGR